MKRFLITFLILIVLGSCVNFKKVSAEEVENKSNDDYNVVAVDLNTGAKTVEEISNKVEQSELEMSYATEQKIRRIFEKAELQPLEKY